MEIIPQFLLVMLLVFLNGFFVASEFALVGVRKTRITELARKNNRAAKLVKGALDDLDTYISSTQLGITLASLGLGWIGEPAIAHFLSPYFSFLPENIAYVSAHTIAVIVAFSIITFLHIVLGELAPKSIALQRSEHVSLFIIAPLLAFTKVFKPFIYILNGAGSLVLRLFGLSAPSGHQLVHSEEEIKMILEQSEKGGALEENEVEMVYNVFRLGELPVKSIMVPRTNVVAFNITTPINEVVTRVEDQVHSRFPVYERSIDNIIGFIHVKDIYKLVLHSNENKRLFQTTIVRNIIHVPETKRADETLLDMRNRGVHLAVVNDEFGGTAGIVTLEDIIESLVGDIQDEFDKPLRDMKKQKDGSYLVDGLASIESVQHKFNLQLKGQGYITIGGLVFGLLGHEPQAGDSVQIGSIIFEVVTIERNRIKTVKVRRESRPKTKQN